MGSSWLLLILTLLSSIGDTIFLVGLPMHLYKSSGNTFVSTTYVSILIYLTVFICRKYIIKIQSEKKPIDIVIGGELAMGALEVLVLVIYFYFQSDWVLILSVIPLALLYNLYAVPKFFDLQDYFHRGELVKFTALLSFFRESGIFIGVLIAGFLIEKYSIFEVLIADAFSFILFGISILLYKLYFRDDKYKQDKISKEVNVDKSKYYEMDLKTFMIISSIVGFFLSWQQSSLIPVVNNSYGIPLDEVSMLRTVFGAIGLSFGLYLINKKINIQKMWCILTLSVPAFVFTTFFLGSYVMIITMLIAMGLLKAFSDAGKKACYMQYKANNKYPSIASVQWTTESLFKLTLIPLAYFIDVFAKGQSYTLIVYFLLLFFVACIVGYLNYEFIKKRHYS